MENFIDKISISRETLHWFKTPQAEETANRPAECSTKDGDIHSNCSTCFGCCISD